LRNLFPARRVSVVGRRYGVYPDGFVALPRLRVGMIAGNSSIAIATVVRMIDSGIALMNNACKNSAAAECSPKKLRHGTAEPDYISR
jgi:hypothetical protein